MNTCCFTKHSFTIVETHDWDSSASTSQNETITENILSNFEFNNSKRNNGQLKLN